MNAIIFSQASIFHLYRLGHLIFATTGIRHRLSDDLSMLMLIKYCSTSTDPIVNRQFSAFLSTVDDKTIEQLAKRKIIPFSYRPLNTTSRNVA